MINQITIIETLQNHSSTHSFMGQHYAPKMLIKTESFLVQGIANKSNDQAPEFNFLCCDVSRENANENQTRSPLLQFTLAKYFDSYHRHILHVNQS